MVTKDQIINLAKNLARFDAKWLLNPRAQHHVLEMTEKLGIKCSNGPINFSDERILLFKSEYDKYYSLYKSKKSGSKITETSLKQVNKR